MVLRTLLILALLLVPAASATLSEPATDVKQYISFIATQQTPDGTMPETVVSIVKPHTYNVTTGTSILEVSASYTTQSGGAVNPIADYRVLWDGAIVDNCQWHVQGGTITGGRFNPTIAIYCQLTDYALPGEHTIQVERTNVVGQPVVASTTSIILHQRDTVMHNITDFEALTGMTALELFLLVALFFAIIYFWSLSNLVGVQFLMFLAMLADMVLWLLLWVQIGFAMHLAFVVLCLAAAIYMIAKTVSAMLTEPVVI